MNTLRLIRAIREIRGRILRLKSVTNCRRQSCDLCVLLRLKPACSGSVFELMNGRKRSQRSQTETPENLCGATRIELLVVRRAEFGVQNRVDRFFATRIRYHAGCLLFEKGSNPLRQDVNDKIIHLPPKSQTLFRRAKKNSRRIVSSFKSCPHSDSLHSCFKCQLTATTSSNCSRDHGEPTQQQCCRFRIRNKRQTEVLIRSSKRDSAKAE